MRRRTTYPANYARGPQHAPRAKSTWPGAPSAPCALESRGTLSTRRGGARWRKPAPCCPLGPRPWSARGFRLQFWRAMSRDRPPGNRRCSAPTLKTRRGRTLPEALDLPGIHLRNSRRGGGGAMVDAECPQGPPGTAPQCALHRLAPAGVQMADCGSLKKQGDTRRPPNARAGREPRDVQKRGSRRRTRILKENTPLRGRAAASRLQPGGRVRAGPSAAASPPQQRGRGGRLAVPACGRFTFYFLPLHGVGSPPGPSDHQQ